MKIKIVTGYDGNCIYKDILLDNLNEYASKHHYQLISKFDGWDNTNRHPYWRKLELVKENFFDCDYLLWIDADCMFIDMNRKLESLIDGSDLIITKEDVVQAGCFLIKNTKEVSKFLDYWWKKGAIIDHWNNYSYLDGTFDTPNNDNVVLINILENEELGIIVKYLTNMDFVTKHIHFHENPNPFISHVVGSPEEEKLSFMNQFKQTIKR